MSSSNEIILDKFKTSKVVLICFTDFVVVIVEISVNSFILNLRLQLNE